MAAPVGFLVRVLEAEAVTVGVRITDELGAVPAVVGFVVAATTVVGGFDAKVLVLVLEAATLGIRDTDVLGAVPVVVGLIVPATVVGGFVAKVLVLVLEAATVGAEVTDIEGLDVVGTAPVAAGETVGLKDGETVTATWPSESRKALEMARRPMVRDKSCMFFFVLHEVVL